MVRRLLSALVFSAVAVGPLTVACSSDSSPVSVCSDGGCMDGNIAAEATEEGVDGGIVMEATTEVIDSGIALEAGEGTTPAASGCPDLHPPRSGQPCAPEGVSCTGQDYGYGWCAPACTCSGGTWSCVPSTCSCPSDALPYSFMTEPCYDKGQQCEYQAGCTSCTCQGYGDAGPFAWSCTSTCRDGGEPLWCLTEAGYCPG